MPDADEPRPDPAGVNASINRYRELAKYLITIFAGVGALLVAGSQLTSLGALSWDDSPKRVLAAVLGLVVAVLAVLWIIWAALKILRPIEMSLDELTGDEKLREAVEARPSLLHGAGSLAGLSRITASPALDDKQRERWKVVADEVVDFAVFLRANQHFRSALTHMLVAALLGTAAIAAFAWGANPPEEETADPVVRPAPVLVEFELTDEGRDTLGGALGERCAAGRVRALTIGGEEGAPRVVTIPTATCRSAQFVLADEYGAVISTKKAPAK